MVSWNGNGVVGSRSDDKTPSVIAKAMLSASTSIIAQLSAGMILLKLEGARRMIFSVLHDTLKSTARRASVIPKSGPPSVQRDGSYQSHAFSTIASRLCLRSDVSVPWKIGRTPNLASPNSNPHPSPYALLAALRRSTRLRMAATSVTGVAAKRARV